MEIRLYDGATVKSVRVYRGAKMIGEVTGFADLAAARAAAGGYMLAVTGSGDVSKLTVEK